MLRYLLPLTVLLHSPTLSEGQNVSGVLDKSVQYQLQCNCPDCTFPLHRMESLEYTAYNLNITFQQEITKIQSYHATFSSYLQKIQNLTRRVEVMEKGDVTYNELDFELLKLEIKEMESLVVQLRASVGGSSVSVDTLYTEIRNISIMVNQLESYDNNNVLAVRREVEALRQRLKDCGSNQTMATPPNYGSCDHGDLANISKPVVVQYNYKNAVPYGGWGKDSFTGATNKDLYFVAPVAPDTRNMDTFRLYKSYDDLMILKNGAEKQLWRLVNGAYDYTSCGQGSGMIVYNNSLYYNCYNSREVCRVNLDTYALERKTLVNAAFNNRFSYAGVNFQDIDFSADENGLWVIYATEESAGNIIIGKLNRSLMVERSWTTSQYKPGVTNAFMICGVMYATRPVTTSREEIFYMYDTKTSQERLVKIPIDKVVQTVQSLSYNPNDRKLYMYNDGFQVTYDVKFLPSPAPK